MSMQMFYHRLISTDDKNTHWQNLQTLTTHALADFTLKDALEPWVAW